MFYLFYGGIILIVIPPVGHKDIWSLRVSNAPIQVVVTVRLWAFNTLSLSKFMSAQRMSSHPRLLPTCQRRCRFIIKSNCMQLPTVLFIFILRSVRANSLLRMAYTMQHFCPALSRALWKSDRPTDGVYSLELCLCKLNEECTGWTIDARTNGNQTLRSRRSHRVNSIIIMFSAAAAVWM